MRIKEIEIDVDIHHETDKALHVSTDGVRSNAVWIPKSLCELQEQGLNTVLIIKEDIAIEKGLI